MYSKKKYKHMLEQKSAKRRYLCGALCALLVCCGAPAAFASETTLAELWEKQERLQVQKEINDQRLEQLQEDALEKAASRDELYAQVQAAQEELDGLRTEIDELNQEVARLENKISGKKAQIQQNMELLKARIRALYVTGDAATVEIILNSSSFVEAAHKAQLLKAVTQRDRQLIESLTGQIKAIEGDLIRIDQDKQQIAARKKEAEAKSAQLVELYQQAQQLAASAQDQTLGVQAIGDMLEAQIQENDEAIGQLEEELYGRRITGVGSTAGPTGTFAWPMPGYTYLTCNFGDGGHRGIDIAGGDIYGKPVVAADGGTVLYAGWNDSYGYCVFIDHGNGYETRYAHMSELAVETGDSLEQNQVVGYVGSTGNSTGPHLHFEVIFDGELYDPMSYFG